MIMRGPPRLRLKSLHIAVFAFALGNFVGRFLDPSNFTWLVPVERACVAWRQTTGCNPDAEGEEWNDRSCEEWIPDGWSGYCECEGGVRLALSTCEHSGFTCGSICSGKSPGEEEQRGVVSDGYDAADNEMENETNFDDEGWEPDWESAQNVTGRGSKGNHNLGRPRLGFLGILESA
jgi:hypothetical protein